jgi:DNA (cytosine-5)-methyltransferase 1
MGKMRVLDLFSGIGGFSLGLERSGGFETVAFVEIDPYCRAVLRKHWPDVPVYDDVRTLTVDEGWLVSDADKRCELAQEQLCAGRQGIRADSIDVIAGGFPCQDISVAGKGAGLAGERSGLWSEFARIIGEVLPRYVIVENVAVLLSQGLGDVLGDLAALGYDAEWHCIPAQAVGAPHRRDRVWIVANSSIGRCGGSDGGEVQQPRRTETVGGSETVADAFGITGRPCGLGDTDESARGRHAGRSSLGADDVSDADSSNGYGRRGPLQMGWGGFAREATADGDAGRTQWRVEPDVGRVAHGVPARVDRLRALGNAVVPQIPEIIGRAIMMQAKGWVKPC